MKTVPRCEALADAHGQGGLTTRGQIVLASCACAGFSAFLYTVDPSRHAVYPTCLFHQATGLYCAGCGATRALYALLHGRVLDALHDNALFVGVLPFAAAVGGIYLWQGWRGNAWPRWNLRPPVLARTGFWVFFAMLVFMAIRNLPGMPFDLLKPLAAN